MGEAFRNGLESLAACEAESRVLGELPNAREGEALRVPLDPPKPSAALLRDGEQQLVVIAAAQGGQDGILPSRGEPGRGGGIDREGGGGRGGAGPGGGWRTS